MRKSLILLLAVTALVSACGVDGAPEPPNGAKIPPLPSDDSGLSVSGTAKMGVTSR